ncbi:MAG: universal stress protein [Desulfobacteraceae bacterium]|jgi:nucleotide-binding universal stress UspA family protein|nr:universal stress protein [Desulfobacteraceae bacterium]
MYHVILVPLDGSKRAEAILPHVEELARRYEARVVFLGVVEPVVLADAGWADLQLSQQIYDEQVGQTEAYLGGLKGEFREKGIRAQVRVGHGSPVDAIIATAEAETADLVAMASHGRTGLARAFYGSVAAGVLNRVDRPLLMVRSREAD